MGDKAGEGGQELLDFSRTDYEREFVSRREAEERQRRLRSGA